MELTNLLIAPDRTVLEAMKAVEDNGCEVAFVTGERGEVAGIVTVGDMRRGLLRGLGLDAPVRRFMNVSFKSVRPDTDRNQVLDLMRSFRIRQIPVLDEQSRLVGIHLLNDFIGMKARNNAAVIMAGGKGMRLRPITENLPKPLVKVAGRPIIERLVTHLVGHGIKKIYIAVNYLGRMIEDHFKDGGEFGCSIEYLREEKELGTGGALSLLPEIPKEPILVINGDLVTDANIGDIFSHHQKMGHEATMVVKLYNHVIPYGVVNFKDGRLTGLTEKPSVRSFVNAGIYVLSPSILELAPRGEFFPITNLFEQCLEKGRPVSAYVLNEDWRDLGCSEELRMARGDFD